MSAVAPGWYVAETPNLHRWWDGEKWTEHVRVMTPQPQTAGFKWLDISPARLVIAAVLSFFAASVGFIIAVLRVLIGNDAFAIVISFLLAVLMAFLGVILLMNYNVVQKRRVEAAAQFAPPQ